MCWTKSSEGPEPVKLSMQPTRPLRSSRLDPTFVGLVLIASLFGCGGSDADTTDMRVDDESAMDTTPAGTAAPPSLPGIATDISRQTSIVLSEWKVAPATDALPAGEITFQVMNSGTLMHRLAIEGTAVDARSEAIDAGATAALTVELPPGTYRLYCPEMSEGVRHDGRGMTVPFVVR
jgi:hypothetical protein